MLDWQGEEQKRDRQQILLEDIQEDVNLSATSYIGPVETHAIEELLNTNHRHWPEPTFAAVPEEDDQIVSVISYVSYVHSSKVHLFFGTFK